MMMQIIDYLPVVLYLTLAWIMRLTLREFHFNFHMVLLGLTIPAHLFISAYVTGNLLSSVIGIAIGVLLYLVLVFFMGGKASGETLLIIPATIALAPFPKAILFVVLGIFLVFVASVFAMRKQMDMVKGLMYDTMLRSGMGGAVPDYSELPDRKSVTADQKTISVIPFMLIAMVIGVLWTLFA